MKILGIPGSLRGGSLNRALLEAAGELLPERVELAVHALHEIELYNEDRRAEGVPSAVTALGDAIGAADAVLVVTPEYNYSVPGVLKNAIDWVSRLEPQPFDGKAVAIMGASPGRLGTARAQYHLRQVFVFLNARVLNRPEIMVAGASSVFDASGRLTDRTTRALVAKQLEALKALAG